MFTEGLIRAAGLQVNLATGPQHGPPLLMLHGVGRRWQDFLPLLPGLAPRWQLRLLDHRGHGLSERGASYRVIDYVDDAVAIAEQLAEPAVVYGHSLGAMVALAIAARAPRKVTAAVLEDPPFETLGRAIRHSAFFAQFAGMYELLSAGTPADQLPAALTSLPVTGPDGRLVPLGTLRDAVSLRFMASCLTRLDPAVFAPLVEGRWLDGYSLDELLPEVRCPVLLLRANPALGGMLTEREARRLVERLPDCTLVERPQAGHLIHWVETEAALRTVQAFLETVRV